MAFTTGTATFTNGSTSVTSVVLSGGSTSYFGSGTRVLVGNNPVVSEVEAISAPSAGTFTLRDAWTLPTGSYPFLANMTSEGIRDAAQTLRDALALVEQFNVDVNPTANTIAQRDASGRINAVAGTSGTEVLTFNNIASQAQSEAAVSNSVLMTPLGTKQYTEQFGLEYAVILSTGESALDIDRVSGNYHMASTVSDLPSGVAAGSAIVVRRQTQAQGFTLLSSVVSDRLFFATNKTGVYSDFFEIYSTANLLSLQNTSGALIASNATTAGSNLTPVQTGTWRNISGNDIANNGFGTWQKI